VILDSELEERYWGIIPLMKGLAAGLATVRVGGQAVDNIREAGEDPILQRYFWVFINCALMSLVCPGAVRSVGRVDAAVLTGASFGASVCDFNTAVSCVALGGFHSFTVWRRFRRGKLALMSVS
jgi:hypothetical protein